MGYEDTGALTSAEDKKVAGHLSRVWASEYLKLLDGKDVDPAWMPVMLAIGEEMKLISTDFIGFLKRLEWHLKNCEDANDAAVIFAAYHIYSTLFFEGEV